jgi:hypothetical protein
MLVRLNSEHWCHKIFILLQKNARSLADFQILITNLHIENTQSSQARRVGIFTFFENSYTTNKICTDFIDYFSLCLVKTSV